MQEDVVGGTAMATSTSVWDAATLFTGSDGSGNNEISKGGGRW